MYKISQDHLELFFGTIRSLEGYNNNPTSRKFQSAYKKLVVHTHDIENFNTGIVFPLDHIEILYYSTSDPIKMINSSAFNNNVDLVSIEENVKEIDKFITIKTNYNFSNFTKEIIIYIGR